MKSWFINAQSRVRNGWKILAFLTVLAAIFSAIRLSKSILPALVIAHVPAAVFLIVGILIASAAATRMEGHALSSIGLQLGWRFAGQFALGLVGGAALLGFAAIGVWLLNGYHLIASPQSSLATLAGVAGMSFVVAIFEELLFRGYIFQRAIQGIGAVRAQIVVATFFCLAHLPGNTDMGFAIVAPAMLTLFLLSVVLGASYLRTGSLALPIGIHMGWNWLQVILGFANSGIASTGLYTPVFHHQPVWLTGGAFGLEASVVAVLVLFLASLALATRPLATTASAH